MSAALALAGLAMGAAATPHCLAMCGAPCASLTAGRGRNAVAFHGGRLVGYMAAGAVAASGIAALGAWSQAAPALRPLWLLLHLAFLALGAWWLITGRSPDLLRRDAPVPVVFIGRGARPLRSGLAGLAWVAWPCGALQGALLLAALAQGAFGGALVMAAFAIGSMPALAAAPWAWSRIALMRGGAAARARVENLGLRIAGLGVVLASSWALGHGLWERAVAWCT